MNVIWRALWQVGTVWVIHPVSRRKYEYVDEVKKICGISIERRYSPAWFLSRVLSKCLPMISTSLGCIHLPIEKLGVDFDVIVVSRLFLAGRLKPWLMGLPILIDVDDTPVVDYQLEHPGNVIRTWLVRKWQDRLCAKAKLLWVPDKRQFSDFPRFNIAHLPNIPAVDIGLSAKRRLGKNLLFVGYLAHPPNQVALDWFLRTCWADIHEKYPHLIFDIVGGGLPKKFLKLWSSYPNVNLHGYVESLNNVYANTKALIAPMKIGSGTCIKVLEALSLGVPVLATSQGLRGISAENHIAANGIFHFEDAKSFLEALESVLPCEDCFDGARKFIDMNYSEKVVVDALKKGILSCVS